MHVVYNIMCSEFDLINDGKNWKSNILMCYGVFFDK